MTGLPDDVTPLLLAIDHVGIAVPDLDAAAIEWVKTHWLYQPAKQGSRAVASVTDAVVTFRLQ